MLSDTALKPVEESVVLSPNPVVVEDGVAAEMWLGRGAGAKVLFKYISSSSRQLRSPRRSSLRDDKNIISSELSSLTLSADCMTM